MANQPKLTVKALVDKGSNKVIVIEPGTDFADVLLSFLTIPMATVIRLAETHSDSVVIGCMTNLYASVENMDAKDFMLDTCRDVLLHPRNAAQPYCQYLSLKLDDSTPASHYVCRHSMLYHPTYFCDKCSLHFTNRSVSVGNSRVGSVFLKEQTRLTVTDDFKVIPQTASTGFAFSQLGVMDMNATEELTVTVGTDEMLSMLICSLASKTPITDTLLKDKQKPTMRRVISTCQGISNQSQTSGDMKDEEEEGKVFVKLVVSKSKKMVCYAEAQEDFVNLLFSFLTLPVAFILKNLKDGFLNGCIGQLYESVLNLDEQQMNSRYHKEVVIDAKILPGFCYKNSLLGVEEASYYYLNSLLTTDRSVFSSESYKLKFDDSKYSSQGFLKGPAVFVITDNLFVRPMSRIYEVSVLKDLNVPLTDIEEHTVPVGKKEALHLLLASFVGESALTNTFVRERAEPKQEH